MVLQMAKEYYGEVGTIIHWTGIQPGDLGYEDVEGGKTADAQLEEFIEDRLVEIKSIIDQHRNRDYLAEGDVPPGITNIAMRICSNLLAHAVLRRTTPIVRVEDYAVDLVEEKFMTKSIRDDLNQFPAKLDGKHRRLGIMKVRGKYDG